MACSGGGGGSSRKAKAGEVGSEDDQDEASADDAHEARETAAAAGEARLEQLGLWARMRRSHGTPATTLSLQLAVAWNIDELAAHASAA